MVENGDITLLAKLCQETLTETRAIRRDLAGVQRPTIKTVEALTNIERRNEARNATVDGSFSVVDVRRTGLDRRMSDLKDDLELMIKSELMGALGNVETRMVGLIEERLAHKD